MHTSTSWASAPLGDTTTTDPEQAGQLLPMDDTATAEPEQVY